MKPVYISDEQRSLHCEIIGTTGSGKTGSVISQWSIQDIQRGKGTIIVDAKGDIELFQKIHYYHQYQNNYNQDIKLINIADTDNSHTYNPLERGNAIELKDRIMQSMEWSEQFYKNEAESTLLTILEALKSIDEIVTFDKLHMLLSNASQLEGLKEMVTDESIKEEIELYLLSDFEEVQENCKGLITQLKLLNKSFGSIANVEQSEVNLLNAYQNNDILFFSLPSNLVGNTARQFGRMLLMDLKATAGYIEQHRVDRKFYPVFIDEFAEFATEEFISWLNKARSSGYSIHIAHQSLADLSRIDDSFATQVTDNTNLKVVFRVNNAETAEKLADQLGTKQTYKNTERVEQTRNGEKETGLGSRREVEQYIVHPNKLKNELRQGEALIFGKHPEFFWGLIKCDHFKTPQQNKLVDVNNLFPNRNNEQNNFSFTTNNNKQENGECEDEPMI